MGERHVNRWAIFLAAYAIIFVLGSVSIFSVFGKPLAQAHNWSSIQVSWGLTIYLFSFTLSGIFFGRIADLYGAKKNMYMGALIFGLGWYLTGQVNTLPMFYLTYGVIAAAGSGMMYNPCLAAVMRWFPDKTGQISGLLLSSAAVGPAIQAPLAAMLLQQYPLSTSFALIGICFTAVILLTGWLIETAPADFRPADWNPSPAQRRGASGGPDHTWQQMVRTGTFWLLVTTYVCSTTAGIMLIRSISDMAQKQIGVTATVAAFAVSISTIANFGGRLFLGTFFDKLGGFKSLYLIFATSIAALLIMTAAKTWAMFILCIILLGFAFGGALVVFPPFTRKYFGVQNLGVNYGIMFMGYAGGAFVGPMISSYFIDTYHSFYGSYLVASIVSVIGIFLTILLSRKDKKATSAKTNL
jgi:OFA family oxalate/formate antiporter-like MFS transporter